jgi:hypothetical protein
LDNFGREPREDLVLRISLIEDALCLFGNIQRSRSAREICIGQTYRVCAVPRIVGIYLPLLDTDTDKLEAHRRDHTV